MREIMLHGGRTALVDDEDFECLNRYSWHFHPSHTGDPDGYAATQIKDQSTGKWKTVFMHTLVHGGAQRLDHQNGHKLDNRRENLRPATGTQNAGNSKDRSGSSRFKGVCWHKLTGKWQAQLMTTINGRAKCQHLGCFNNEEDASEAYRQAAADYFGAFAKT